MARIGNTIDIAGTYKQINSLSEVDTWKKESGLDLSFESSKVDVEDGIKKLDSYLMPHPVSKKPKIYISQSAVGLRGELGGGPPKFDNGGVYKRNMRVGTEAYGTPIDANNHACKALAYFLVNHFGYSEVVRNRYGAEKQKAWSYVHG